MSVDLVTELRRVVALRGDTYSSYEVVGLLGRAADEIERLRKIDSEIEGEMLHHLKILAKTASQVSVDMEDKNMPRTAAVVRKYADDAFLVIAKAERAPT